MTKIVKIPMEMVTSSRWWRPGNDAVNKKGQGNNEVQNPLRSSIEV